MTTEGAAEIAASVKGFLEEECGLAANEVGPDTPLFSSRRLDSIDILRIVAFIERRFAIAVAPLDVTVERFDTLGRLSGFVKDRLASRT